MYITDITDITDIAYVCVYYQGMEEGCRMVAFAPLSQ
jgi:hypothetical protein